VSRIASSVDCTGIPYRSPAQPSSTVISSSRRARPSSISSAVARAIRSTWSRVSCSFALASIPITRRGRSCPANPAIIPACVDPVTAHTMIVSKKTPSSRSCCSTSTAQFANPSPPSRWSEAPAGIAYGVPPRASTSARASFQLSLKPIPNPAGSSRTSAPMIRLSMMFPTRSLSASGQSTQFSCTSTAFNPTFAATAATCRVWFD
jgi:hypothetical protein